MGPVECLTCGKVVDGRDGDFCSDDCSDDWYNPDPLEDDPYEYDDLEKDDDSCDMCGDPDCFGECCDEERLPEEDV
jgi:hypothetical protein